MRKIKIIFCGSHFSPAYAVMESLIKRKNFEIYYVGKYRSMEGDEALALEYSYIKKLKVKYYSVTNARLQRSVTFWTFPSILKFPAVILQSFKLLTDIKPDLVVSFGGFIALPICLFARALNIPVITHEQTPILGLANRIISRFANITCLSFKNTRYIPKSAKISVTGNPVRSSILNPSPGKKYKFGNSRLPLLYITGGSQGSESINKLVFDILPELASSYRIIHQCGLANSQKDYRRLLEIRNSLSSKHKKNYMVQMSIDPEDTGIIYEMSSLVIGRSGANTVAELGVLGIPALLIPLPWSADNEQLINAELLEKAGLAEVLQQKDLTSGILLKTIRQMLANIGKYRKNKVNYKNLYYINGVEIIIRHIHTLLTLDESPDTKI